MRDPDHARFGVVSTAYLHSRGWTSHRIRQAVAARTLRRLRDGWFALPDADALVVAAVSAGGCVSCADALRLHGAWVPESLGRGHVRRNRRARAAGREGCRAPGLDPRVVHAVDDVETAFRCVLRCGTREDIVVIADSLLHLRLATRHELERWVVAGPPRGRDALRWIDAAESGLETMVRVRLRARRVRVRTQVWVEDMRLDIVVGEVLVIECDGREHHASWTAQTADRARDRRLTTLGYVVVRLTYRQIVDEWDSVERDLLTLVRRHARRSR